MSGATWEIREGDALGRLREMPDESVDAVVTDPPYGLEFMGKDWDAPWKTGDGFRRMRNPADVGRDDPFGRASRRGPEYVAGVGFQAWCEEWAREALRVLKPGGHLLAFGGTRTYHRLACAIEDAGFEVRDCIVWLYGSGFPKSLDVSKAIDKAAGAERTEVVGVKRGHEDFIDRIDAHGAGGRSEGWERDWRSDPDAVLRSHQQFAPAIPEAAAWEGWGTALKPGHEPIVVARKPLAGTVAANVLEHGTGALNIDGCRIPIEDRDAYQRNHSGDRGHDGTRSIEDRGATDLRPGGGSAAGERWPANVVLDEEAAAMLDEQSGTLTSGANPTRRGSDKFRTAYGDFAGQRECEPARGLDVGGASRFFYCAKASGAERNAGLDGFTPVARANGNKWTDQDYRVARGERAPGRESGPRRNHHPTVKPVELMRWLVRLVTPPGGLVLDTFAGSGTTGIAAMREGFSFVGIEREPDYVAIARERIRQDAPLLNTAAEVAT